MQATFDHAAEDAVPQPTENPDIPSWTYVLEGLLDDRESFDDVLVDDASREVVLPRMLLVGIVGLLLFGLAVGLTAQVAGDLFIGSPIVWIPLSLTGGFLTAIAVGLPSFYFYTQLAGLDASFRLVTSQAVRVQARTSMLLLGVLPFYATVALASVLDVAWVDALVTVVVGFGALPWESPAMACVVLGFIAPFVTGLLGLVSVYLSFGRLVDVLPITHPRRGNVLLRMLLMWGAVAGTVAPIAMWRIAEWLMTIT